MVLMVLLPLEVSLDHREEVVLALFKALDQCFPRVSGEMLALNDIIVQVVPQVLGAYMAPMTVEDAKETDLGPLSLPMLVLWLKYVQDNANPVLVVFSNDALVGISGVGFHDSALLI